VKINRDGVFYEYLEKDPSSLFELSDPGHGLDELEQELQINGTGGKFQGTDLSEVSEGDAGKDAAGKRAASGEAEVGSVEVDLNAPVKDVLKLLSKYPVKTRLNLSGTIIVARDIAHARLLGRLQKGGDLPDYFKQYPVYYAGERKWESNSSSSIRCIICG
jgi:hypothetical protein